MIEGEPLRVLPLEDDELLEAAKPVTKDGRIKFDQKKIAAREAEMVRRLPTAGRHAAEAMISPHNLARKRMAKRGSICEFP